MDEDDGDEENKMVGKTKRSRLEESSPGNCVVFVEIVLVFSSWMLHE